jgi:hypothetical protein
MAGRRISCEVAGNLVSPFDTYQAQGFGFVAAPHPAS